MSKHLPTHGFRWLTEDEIRTLVIEHMAENGDDGYILEVDLDYPAHLHNQHNCYPLAAEQLEIPNLTPNLMNKRRYALCTIHYANLKYYLAPGLILKKVHRVLTFK